MDLRKLKTLIDLVSDSNVSELEITEAEGKVRIVKATATQLVQTYMQAPANMAPQSALMMPSVAAPNAADVPVEDVVQSGHVIKSPMVGTFYRASSPEVAPFVDIGSSVKEGQVLCIIEAMKILNEIESDKSGVVKQILVDNGAAVEYGQPLFIVE